MTTACDLNLEHNLECYVECFKIALNLKIVQLAVVWVAICLKLNCRPFKCILEHSSELKNC